MCWICVEIRLPTQVMSLGQAGGWPIVAFRQTIGCPGLGLCRYSRQQPTLYYSTTHNNTSFSNHKLSREMHFSSPIDRSIKFLLEPRRDLQLASPFWITLVSQSPTSGVFMHLSMSQIPTLRYTLANRPASRSPLSPQIRQFADQTLVMSYAGLLLRYI